MVEYHFHAFDPYLDAVKKSLFELLEYADHFNFRLGVENRYHYHDLPLLLMGYVSCISQRNK
jgi:hypothetical protein